MTLAPSWEVVGQFERRMAWYCEAPYAVAVDTCTAALFLCFKRFKFQTAAMPSRTYLGVACAAKHAGCELYLRTMDWTGAYTIQDVRGGRVVVDSACRLNRGMFDGATTCLSFQYRKHLKIGRGGMILTADADDAAWFCKARFCGRAEPNGAPEFVGWHCFMEPERAARGLVLLDSLPDRNEDLVFDYPDLREYEVLR